MPVAGYLSIVYVYRIQAFFLHQPVRKLLPPLTLLISHYNTRTLLTLCRQSPGAFTLYTSFFALLYFRFIFVNQVLLLAFLQKLVRLNYVISPS